jgi:hypothetical protein
MWGEEKSWQSPPSCTPFTLKISALLDFYFIILYSNNDRAFQETGRYLFKLNLSGNRGVRKSKELEKCS